MPEKEPLLRELADKARRGAVTFVYAAKDREHSSAVVLRRLVERRSLGRSK